MPRLIAAIALLALAAGCTMAPPPTASPPGRDDIAERTFVDVLSRVGPEVEAVCLGWSPRPRCDFLYAIEDGPDIPANAGQALLASGQPIILLTVPLILGAENADELAFVFAHEAAHHILGHIDRGRASAFEEARLAGQIAASQGADAPTIRRAEGFGAFIGSRRYSKQFELEADGLATLMTLGAGFDPVRGAAYFLRFPDPGNQVLGTHPPNADRIAAIRRTAAAARRDGF